MARHKVYSLINVLGLALGICACLVIYLVISYEFSFDRFHPGKERIYRFVGEYQRNDGEREFLNSIVPEIGGLENEIPGFEAKAGIHFYYGKITVPGSDKSFDSGNDVVVTWPDYFRIFRYKWLAGDSSKPLSRPYQEILTANKARMYFGALPFDQVIGKTVVYNDSLILTVSGIIEDWKRNTDLPFTDFISISTVSNAFLRRTIPTNNWSSLEPHRSMTFVRLNKTTTAADVNARVAAYIKKHVRPSTSGSLVKEELQPITKMHFTNESFRSDDGDNFRKAHLKTLYIFTGIALFILIIAAINFINLSTAQSLQRAKEVGVRKVLGSSKGRLVMQFLAETFMLTSLAAIIALLLVNPVLSFLRSYLPAGVVLHFTMQTGIFLLITLLVITVLAGFYPARVLSSYLPALSLKGPAIPATDGKLNLRKALIIFQFTISVIFITSTIVITNQINFMYYKDKGFRTDAVIMIENWGDRSGKMKVLLEKIKQVPGVEKAILQGTAPMGFAENEGHFIYKGKEERAMQVAIKTGDENFVPFYQMKLVAGRNMAHGDSLHEFLINETYSRMLGFTKPAEALGQFLYGGDNKPVPIVGVVADFHMGSFHTAIKPVVIAHMPELETSIAVSLATDGKNSTGKKTILGQLEKQWKQVYPESGFNYNFLDDSIKWLFEKEEQTAKLMKAATMIALLISCMGLFGLVMFISERRTKEIGVRKVLGASVADITFLLIRDFVLLILISLLIAFPAAWWLMNQWLDDFTYRTGIGAGVFIFAASTLLLVTLLTTSYQVIKAAFVNPVRSLRTE
jgi:ABC-type antimicrobial peptide transport system permease subunit